MDLAIDTFLAEVEHLGHVRTRAVMRQSRRKGLSPLRALLVAGVPLGTLQKAAWKAQGYETVELDLAGLDIDATASLPLATSRRARSIVVGRDGETVVVAMADPTDVDARDAVAGAVGNIRVVVADPESIDEAISRYEAREIMGDGRPDATSERPRPLALTDATTAGSTAARSLAAMVTYAVNARASDIHVSCTDAGADVRIRIDGVLHPYTHVAGVGAAAGVLGRIKVLGGLDLGQRRLPQDGRIQVDVHGRTVDIRLATIPNVWDSEDAVLRILDSSIGVASLDSLGLGDPALEAWARLWQQPHGLVLVAGPTGSGKSTTLYATLREVATPDRAVRTVEDPVEVRLRGITQVQVNPRAGLTFASALRAFLRADPDIILVGEIRDQETARVATEAAVTGHLVLATVHTSSATQVPVRLTEMGVPGYLVAAALRGAMAQRLVRRLCRYCKVRTRPGPATPWPAEGGRPPRELADPAPRGCARCAHTGYRGRLAVAEVLVVDDATQRAIAEGVSVENMTALAVASGMTALREATCGVVRSGETSLSELARVFGGGDR